MEIKPNQIAIGTAQFGLTYGIANVSGYLTDSEIETILNEARAGGIDTLDTAAGYGNSEIRLGEYGITNWNVGTKLPLLPSDIFDVETWVNQSIEASLCKLKCNTLTSVLVHSPKDLLDHQGPALYSALLTAKKNGLVQKIGYSIYSPAELNELLPRFHPDIIQAPLNVLDRRLVETGWALKLKNAGVEIHIRSVFLQGLLLMNESNRPAKFDPWKNLWFSWNDYLRKENISALEACLQFIYSIPEVDKIIVGIDSVKQLKEIINIKSSGVSMPKFSITDEKLLNPSNWVTL